MAIVESAADGLTLTVPALGLGLPRSYGQISREPDQAAQIQLHHAHQHGDHHRPPQVLHHQTLRQEPNTLEFAHIDDGPKIQQNCVSSSPPAEAPALVNAKNHPSIDELGAPALACANGIINKSESSNDSITSSALGEGLPATLPTSKMSHSVPAQGSLTQCLVDGMPKLEEHPSKLNPLAKEFVPSSSRKLDMTSTTDDKKKKCNSTQGKRNPNGRTGKAQSEESIRRTVYVSDIDQQVTEERLAALFLHCGPVVDCRVCGDPKSVLRFAFVEFMFEEAARAALGLSGTMLGYYPVRVLPSKTAIVPVNPSFLPCSEDEREMCARTVYCTNIDKKVSQANVKSFFERMCGEVEHLRLLGDYRHSTRIAFVEFAQPECAMLALNCSGVILGSLPLRISPSKTPVRSRSPRCL